MTEAIGVIVSIIAAMGIGGIVGAFVQASLQQRRYVRTREQNFKQTRYLAILILMLTQLDPKTGLEKVRQFRNDLKDLDDVKKEIETEFLHSFVFAGDEVIESLSDFIKTPDRDSFIKVAVAMRRDLWGKRTRVKKEILEVFDVDKSKLSTVLNKGNEEKIGQTEDVNKMTKLLKYIAQGGLYGSLFAIAGIAYAFFENNLIGASVVFFLASGVWFALGSKQLTDILNPSGEKLRRPWEELTLSIGIFLIAISLIELIDNIFVHTQEQILNVVMVSEGIIGIVLTITGFLWVKSKQR